MTVSHIYAHRRERSEPPTYSFCSLTTYSIAHTHTHTHTQNKCPAPQSKLHSFPEAGGRYQAPHAVNTRVDPTTSMGSEHSTVLVWYDWTCCDPRGYHWWRDQTFGFLTSTDSKLKTTQITPHSSSDKINKLKKCITFIHRFLFPSKLAFY